MSYREDLKIFGDERAKRRRLLSLIIKFTVVLLAVAFVAVTVMLIVDMADGGSNQGGYGNVSGGASSNKGSTGSLTVKLKGNADRIYVYVGGTVAWKSQIDVTGNSGSYTVKVTNSNVNLNKEGTYTVLYTVTDASNKTAKLKATVEVYKTTYDYEKDLKPIIEKKVNEWGITSSMSKSEQVKKIYAYANGIKYVKESNTPNINRADWEKGWIDEAMYTFNGNSMQGDCYTYYSVSKAFFVYLGIEHIGIQRDNSNIPSSEGTHFWFIVNVGTDTDKWYYYDATSLGGNFSDGTKNACLITLAKLQSYVPSENLGFDFYEFDPTKYPTAEKN